MIVESSDGPPVEDSTIMGSRLDLTSRFSHTRNTSRTTRRSCAPALAA